ncbi:hypothetical protein KR215_008181 [Drosophila sulfurigaster]|nr:hypothetical protein KR215_008181 [Drosophila sulfurigaster]
MEKEKIAFSYNMHFVQLKFCETRLCNWWDILEKFKNILEANCDEIYCLSKKNAGEIIAPMLVTILLTVIVRQLVF